MRRQIILVCLLHFVFSSSVIAQQNWTTYSTADYDKYITAMATEGDTIWYGSSSGLTCFDKVDGTFTRFTTKDGLIDNWINDIVIDRNGVKWIATDNGVSEFDGKSWISYSSENYFNSKKVHSAAVDKDNVKWFAARNTVVSYDNQKWQEYREPYNEKSMNLISVCADSSGVIWFGSEHKGVASFNGNEWSYYDDFEDLYNLTFYTIDVDEHNVKWFGIFDGRLISYDGIEWAEQTVVEDTNARIYDLAVEKNNGLWAATNQGLYHVNNGSLLIEEQDGSTFNTSLKSLSFDLDGILWVGGHLGISSFDGTRFTQSTLLNGPVGETTVSIAIGPDNVKWFGHGGCGISKFDGTFWSAHIHDYSTIGQDIAVDLDNTVWITAGWDGALSFDGNTVNNFYFNRGLESYNAPISEVIVDKENKVWFTGYTGGTYDLSYTVLLSNIELSGYFHAVYLFKSQDGVLWRNDNEHLRGDIEYNVNNEWKFYVKNDYYIKEIIINYENVLWFIAFDTVVNNIVHYNIKSYDDSVWTTYTKENSGLPSNLIYSIAADKNNNIWIGTDAGVSRFDGETWTTFDTENSGLCDNKVNAIAVEKNNTIWFGTENGVSKYTGEIITTSVDDEEQTPESIPLIKTYPNPFNPSTTIEFTLPESGFATISIYSMAGQKIRELTADFMPAGTHTLMWDGRDASGNAVSSGIYITRMKAGKYTATGRMVLIK